MSLFVDPPFALGQTLGVTSATQGENWVGVVKVFPDVNPRTGTVRSNRVKKCIAVRNTSGVTLYGKRGVSFVAGSKREVSGYVFKDGRDNVERAGVTDEYLPPAGVANNDVFWVTVEGPTDLLINVNTQPGQHAVGTTLAASTQVTAQGGTGGYGVTVNATEANALTHKGVYYGRVAVTANTTAAQAGVLVHLKEVNL